MVVLPLVVKHGPIKNIAQLPHLGGSALSWAVLSWAVLSWAVLSWAGQAVAVCDVRVDVVGAEDDKAITTAEDCRDYGLGANLAHWRIGELQECSQGQGCHSFELQARRRLNEG